ncbi:hypothetical protein D0C36_20495 [Mucilaginibacter conchicola]|uniref:histidine kinase n=1 Tax=Mucilaginibacter conchicola TaxID=2303333 RepID=A0A372NQT1_9SPHI|nr:ATP-binding protein [Mucilaginibacter conchicola]RFZ91309.1 hypothetical protein D0C36_20495 [Mucilaginibacter conchicola]
MSFKPLSFFLIVFLLIDAGARGQEVISYDHLPPEGLSLGKGWRMTTIDNPSFARVGINDAEWTPIDPALGMDQLSQLKKTRIGWMRMHFKVGDQLSRRALLLSVFQNCASEIYLDGKLVKKYGVLSSRPASVVPVGANLPPEEIRLDGEGEHVFAVRFAPWQTAFYIKMDNSFFMLGLNSFDNWQAASQAVNESNGVYIVLLSVFSLLSLLHLSFYRYDPTQRANLYFSWYAVISTITFFMVAAQASFHDLRLHSLVRLPSFILSLMTGIWSARALSSLFGFRAKKLIAGMWVIYILSTVSILLYGSGFLNFDGTLILFTSVHIFLLVKALTARRPGAGIIAAGFGASVLAAIVSAVVQYRGLQVDIRWFQTFVGVIYLAPALGISLYLAREFALKSNLLRDKLVQVENLSAQNLAYEQDKQQLLTHQNEKLEIQVKERTSALTRSLDELRTAQDQLIQAAKMASLGELTAGIAHEIQNPLNFVNNFSEVSAELISELEEELDKGDLEEARHLSTDIRQNLEKINLHGKRADNIVKGMLEHSRVSNGSRETTDMVKLIEEYFRLSYHAVRAKDRSFNVQVLQRYEDNLPLVTLAPQDIGRVLLNIFNNAFYAMRQRLNLHEKDYQPTLELTLTPCNSMLEISIADNGTGIPEPALSKIMQPFFTTKPAGEGTGLGLSLSYDIIVKGHGGKMDIRNRPGGGAIAMILLSV